MSVAAGMVGIANRARFAYLELSVLAPVTTTTTTTTCNCGSVVVRAR